MDLAVPCQPPSLHVTNKRRRNAEDKVQPQPFRKSSRLQIMRDLNQRRVAQTENLTKSSLKTTKAYHCIRQAQPSSDNRTLKSDHICSRPALKARKTLIGQKRKVDEDERTEAGVEETEPDESSANSTYARDQIRQPPIYEPLARDRRETRLITILPFVDHSASIECTIRKVSLDDSPFYTALSYAWGNPKITAPILLNGAECHVTTNLESALRHIRSEVHELVYWVDAICINQNDPSERNHQVQLMRDIYSNAEVLVWLGDEEDDSDLAIDRIEELSAKFQEFGELELVLQDVGDLFNPHVWDGTRSLFERSWWKRLWVVQEVVLTKEVTVMCGHKTLLWDSIFYWGAICVLLQEPKTWKTWRPLDLDEFRMLFALDNELARLLTYRRNYQARDTDTDLLTLLESYRLKQSTDPRDKLYALLGLASDASDFMAPDYAQPVSKIFSDATRTIIQRDRRLEILRHGGIGSQPAADRLKLPSWVPDWTFGQRLMDLSLHEYFASNKTNAVVRLSTESSQILFAQGILYDQISFLEPPDFLIPEQRWEPLILYSWKNYDSKIYPTGIPE
jgi:hypothetical protein